jgi:tetratricopeptide (TPR) repeat protein
LNLSSSLIVALLALSAPATALDSSVDTDLSALLRVASSYPPRLSGPEDRAKATSLWHSLRATLESAVSEEPDSDSYDVRIRLGLLFRCGYNLDLKEAPKDKVKEHLRKASELEPVKFEPHLILGEFYVSSNQAVEAERELLLAQALAGDPPNADILRNLCFATYYQKDFQKSARWCKQALPLDPGNPGIKLLLEKSEGVLKGEPAPRTVPVTLDGAPDGKLKKAE